MAIPPQFQKKNKAHAKEDAKDGGKDNAKEDANGNLKKAPHKGQNPFQMNAKRKLLIQQARGGK